MGDRAGLAVVVMCLLAVQVAVQPISTRAFVSRDVVKSSRVLMCELLKIVIGACALTITGQWRQATRNWSLRSCVVNAGLPAIIYAGQNVLIQIAYENLDGLTFNLLNQTKIIMTAVFLYIFMGKRQSLVQCLALGMLFGSSVLLSQQKSETKENMIVNSFEYGVVPVLLASACSGIASALTQWTLQAGDQRNSFLYSMELGLFSSLTLPVLAAFTGDLHKLHTDGLFFGWEPSTFIPITINAFGGVVVGLVMKYAGGVRKGFAIMGGIVMTAFLETYVYGTTLSAEVLMALPLVVVSMFLHFHFPWRPSTSTSTQPAATEKKET